MSEQKWIPVGERMPDCRVEVLAWVRYEDWPSQRYRGSCVVAEYAPGLTQYSDWADTVEGDWLELVTHWMPLPDPPEVK